MSRTKRQYHDAIEAARGGGVCEGQTFSAQRHLHTHNASHHQQADRQGHAGEGAVKYSICLLPDVDLMMPGQAPDIIINRRGKVERRNPTIAHVASPWMRQA